MKKKRVVITGRKFYLLGYSFGVSVALEMASILENEGHEGTVYCLDSSPEVFPLQLSAVFGDMNEQQMQDAIVKHMYSLMADSGLETLTLKLKTAQTWEDKLMVCMQQLCSRVPYSTQYARMQVNSAYARIRAALKYDSGRLRMQPLKSSIILIKGKRQFPELTDTATDFSLGKYTKQVPIVYELDADHSMIPYDPRCTSIINRHLDSTILQLFKERNLCDTYLLNANKFMDVASKE